MQYHRAVVFPGQGTAGGEVSGEVREAVRDEVGDGEIPYQLSVFARSVDLFRSLQNAGVSPDVVAGHSLGEYAAAHAAGCFDLGVGVRLVAARDRLMNQCSREISGGMVAVIGGDPAQIDKAVSEAPGVVVAANYNTPRQTVISGEKRALKAIADEIKGRKVSLEVAGAFHSPLMEDASAGMDELLDGVDFEDPVTPMVSATDGKLLESAEQIREALKRQMLSPVRWTLVVEKFGELGVEEIVEAGEGGTLVRMLRDFKGLKFEGRKASEALA